MKLGRDPILHETGDPLEKMAGTLRLTKEGGVSGGIISHLRCVIIHLMIITMSVLPFGIRNPKIVEIQST